MRSSRRLVSFTSISTLPLLHNSTAKLMDDLTVYPDKKDDGRGNFENDQFYGDENIEELSSGGTPVRGRMNSVEHHVDRRSARAQPE
jgi:hypothetical protein